MQNLQNNFSRRKFITTVTGAGAAILTNPFSSWLNDEIDPKIKAIVNKTIGIDTHNHIDALQKILELPTTKIDLFSEMKKSGFSAICMTFAVDRPKLTQPGEAYERFINGLDAMDDFLKKNKIVRSLNLADLKSAHKNHTPTVIQSVEGGHFLEGKLERLEVAYSRGLRHLGLLHDAQPSVPIGDIYTDPPQFGGLTEFGAQVISECNRLGILIDLTHCSNDTINAALKISTKPIVISHTGLDTQLGKNENMAKMMRPRLISSAQAKIVANSGGVIGVWTHLAESPTEYVQNVRALVNVIGIEHVCIGTDTKMAKPYSEDKKNNANGTNVNNERPGERTNDAWQNQKNGFYYAIVAQMLKAGFTESDIAKFGGDNFCRVFDVATTNNKK